MNKILHFEDQGQDFLQWEIDEKNHVVDCMPFQYSVWAGTQLFKAEVGKRPNIKTRTGLITQLNYKITDIEEVEHDRQRQ